MRALDVGCGPGALTAVLVERLGAASVSAADPSAPFVDACRARLPGVDVVEAAAEALPFADDAFDATVSQLVINFMRDGEAGVREMARVTRPGGVVASCVRD
jgi:ubiquinone/menaquinone biosynthesis C-methylase UbiE